MIMLIWRIRSFSNHPYRILFKKRIHWMIKLKLTKSSWYSKLSLRVIRTILFRSKQITFSLHQFKSKQANLSFHLKKRRNRTRWELLQTWKLLQTQSTNRVFRSWRIATKNMCLSASSKQWLTSTSMNHCWRRSWSSCTTTGAAEPIYRVTTLWMEWQPIAHLHYPTSQLSSTISSSTRRSMALRSSVKVLFTRMTWK